MIKIIWIYLLFFPLIANCQNGEEIYIDSIPWEKPIKYIRLTQDLSLLTYNNKYGNNAPTIDVAIAYVNSIVLYDNLNIDIFPEFEFANLYGGNLYRISGNFGVSKSFFNNYLRSGISTGVGITHRFDKYHPTLNANINNNIKIYKSFGISLVGQIIHRRDLQVRYGRENEWRFSGFIGIYYIL